jgi:mRNA-degrading endonuclease RelE of RelBE toxin-antitoxin system
MKIIAIQPFEKELKRLAKKYPSLKKEYGQLLATLEENPTHGTHLGNDCYKIRIAIASKNKGKRGGGRVITFVYSLTETVYLLTIYDKSEKEDISDNELADYLAEIDLEESDSPDATEE